MLKLIELGILTTLLAYVGTIAPVLSAPQPRPAVTPAPETQFVPKTKIAITSDRLNITLINKTSAAISYQAVGDTQVRTLAGVSTVTLRGLRVPITLTLDRQDSGLLQLTPKQSNNPETLEVTLDTTTNFAADETTLRVEADGSVFLY